MEGLRGSRSREAQCWGARHRDASIFRRCRTSSRLPPSLRLFSHSRDRWIVDVSLLPRALPLFLLFFSISLSLPLCLSLNLAVSLFVPLRSSRFVPHFCSLFCSASFFSLVSLLSSVLRQFPCVLPRTEFWYPVSLQLKYTPIGSAVGPSLCPCRSEARPVRRVT